MTSHVKLSRARSSRAWICTPIRRIGSAPKFDASSNLRADSTARTFAIILEKPKETRKNKTIMAIDPPASYYLRVESTATVFSLAIDTSRFSVQYRWRNMEVEGTC